MQARTTWFALFVATLGMGAAMVLVPRGGWAGQPEVETRTFAYTPPVRTPRGTRHRYVDQSADLVLEQVWTHLEESGLSIVSVDPQMRVIVAQYGGDPRPYVDCGLVTTLVDGAPAEPPQVYAGAKAEQRTAKTVNRRRYGLLRELELDVRLVARSSHAGAAPGCTATRSTSRLRPCGGCARVAWWTSSSIAT